METFYIVWNENKTFGFVTNNKQLAYEARKGSDSNCFDGEGNQSKTAVAFCEETILENCTIETFLKQNPIK